MSSLSLTKGGNLSLAKADPSLVRTTVGIGWDIRTTTGAGYDLDASAILLGANGKVRSDADFIFYNQMSTPNGSVVHQGDNRTGEGEGDDEQIKIDLSAIDDDVERIVIVVSIHDGVRLKQTFGQVRNAFVRLVNSDTDQEVVRYDLVEEASTETVMNFGELYRGPNREWKFRALGQGYSSGLIGLGRDFGLNLTE